MLQLIAEEDVAKDDFKRNQTREKRDQWRNKQSSVKTAFETDKEAYFNTQLEALELANQKHDHCIMWILIDKISEKPQTAAASKVRMLDGSQPRRPRSPATGASTSANSSTTRARRRKQSTFQNQAQTSLFQQRLQRESKR